MKQLIAFTPSLIAGLLSHYQQALVQQLMLMMKLKK